MSQSVRERRRRHVFVTRNTEYHTMDHVCVAVRDRTSGQWYEHHAATGRRLEGGVRVFSNGAVLPSLKLPEVGDAMYFLLDEAPQDRQLVTSRLQAVQRPTRDQLQRYPAA